MNRSTPTHDGTVDRLRIAEHTWGETVPARYAEALVAVNEALMTPKLTEPERLAWIRTTLGAFAHVNAAREPAEE